MNDRQNNDYKVGYGKPPEHSRFVKGKSGNPAGRPRDEQTLDELLEQAARPINIQGGGRRRSATALRLAYEQMYTRATKGSLRDAQEIVRLGLQCWARREKVPLPPDITPMDFLIEESNIEHLRKRGLLPDDIPLTELSVETLNHAHFKYLEQLREERAKSSE